MTFAHGTSVQRLRAGLTIDPYSHKETRSDWAHPEPPLDIPGAFVASASSVGVADTNRQQVITTKSLYCEPGLDVQLGDRIVSGPHTYTVESLPEADVNPFTGWQPVQEIPLREVLG
ncbi:hypothetical protein [Curtobacterium sp. MCSS17_015]|uniref:hypothetical protein n=1 Tax=Curtobacterium sp. MCSS17_015 TaxID=2175666 RepID=UPI000DA7D9DD|nr:hypothetical protein [Curtobacterium sp. MCSS17_015]WIB25425.1 hypothetical protein DEJ18_10185 [Curtobacterium sp. MCSS17_015]